MIIKIDVDGVIRDIMTTMCKLYNGLNIEIATEKNPENIRYYDVEKSFPMFGKIEPWRVKEWFFQDHSKEVFLDSKPFPLAKESIDELKKMGHKIVIVSYQESFENKIHTLQFLNNFGINYDDICFTKNKENIKGDMLVDDNPDFLDKQDENTIRVCVNRSYNKDYTNCQIKVNDLSDLVKILACVRDNVLINSVSNVYKV